MDEQLNRAPSTSTNFRFPEKSRSRRPNLSPTQRDLALAYSPGVAAPCLEIEKDPLAAYKYTARGNLVASSPTAPRCWGSATSARWPVSR
ncbi:NADP-dependent malic enzyme [Klebsiella pneumoniae subsp. pneumoniae]|nr:NADP-dependent malic enzyme [Klebsiella pneumoniae subsp. pneumoniae]